MLKTLIAASLLVFAASSANATMEAAWDENDSGAIAHAEPKCPTYIYTQKGDRLEEHAWSHHVQHSSSPVDAGKCVYF